MFQLSAEHYDLLYCAKGYEREAHVLRERLGRIDPSIHTVLDVACGTGAHDEHLCRFYEVDGLDLRPEFLDAARVRNTRGRYHAADMRDFRLDRLYDVVVCLFSSIGYLGTYVDLVRAFTCFREHLTGRGVVVVEPWITPDAWRASWVGVLEAERGGVHIVRMHHSTRRGQLSVIDFHYLIGEAGRGIVHSREVHELALYTREEIERALTEAGLGDVQFDEEGLTGRGLYLARPPAGGRT